MTRTIILTGARGGQGTSTVAAALAVFAAGHAPAVLWADDPAATAALVGVAVPISDDGIELCPNLVLGRQTVSSPTASPHGVLVIDAGRTPTGPFDEPSPGPGSQPSDPSDVADGAVERYAVLRGPCYVALTTLLNTGSRYAGVIVVAEPGRSLSERDVTDVLGIPVVATVLAAPAIARTIDAGLLLSRLHRHPEFRSLRRLAQPCNISPQPTPDMAQTCPYRVAIGAKRRSRVALGPSRGPYVEHGNTS